MMFTLKCQKNGRLDEYGHDAYGKVEKSRNSGGTFPLFHRHY
jgi:hypothetical protein